MCVAVKNSVGPEVVMWQCNAGLNSLFKFNSTGASLCIGGGGGSQTSGRPGAPHKLCLTAVSSSSRGHNIVPTSGDRDGDRGACLDTQGCGAQRQVLCTFCFLTTNDDLPRRARDKHWHEEAGTTKSTTFCAEIAPSVSRRSRFGRNHRGQASMLYFY